MAASPWRIDIDTGGKFTDACSQPPDSENLIYLKVLSSGQLRLRIIEHLAPDCLRLEIPSNWNVWTHRVTFFTNSNKTPEALHYSPHRFA